jgi:hypothetical protein
MHGRRSAYLQDRVVAVGRVLRKPVRLCKQQTSSLHQPKEARDQYLECGIES